jgi:hypothetical protein
MLVNVTFLHDFFVKFHALTTINFLGGFTFVSHSLQTVVFTHK